MFANPSNGWNDTLPTYQLWVIDTNYIVYRRSPYTWGNEPSSLTRAIEDFEKVAETEKERRLRVSRERNRAHIREARLFAPPPLVEALFDRPAFFRRACGSRWRVMAA